MNPTVTIIVPVRNEEQFIERTFRTILAQDFPADRTEILVIDGMSTDRTGEILARLQIDHPNIQVITNPRRLQSHGMNLGIHLARGEYVVRMDAHAMYAPDYVRRCVELLQRGDAGEVGGVQKAIGTTYFTQAVALAMTHPYGVGDARFRYTKCEIYADTVYLGAWRRSTLLELGGFSNEVNEEGDLNYRLRKAGYRILVSPRIELQYIVRRTLLELVRQYAWYGRARTQTLVRYPDSVRWRQLAAPLLVLALVFSVAIFPVSPPLGLMLPSLYIASDLGVSAALSWRKGIRYFPAVSVIFAAMHISYGLGFFGGMFRFGVPRFSLRSVWRSLTVPDHDAPPKDTGAHSPPPVSEDMRGC